MNIHERQSDDQSNDHRRHDLPNVIAVDSRSRLARGLISSFNRLQNRLYPCDHSTWHIPGAKPWHDFLTNDVCGTEVRQGTFQAIAHFDTNLSLTQCKE